MTRLEETRPSGHGRARGLVNSRVSGSRIEARTFAPPGDLADVVECFWLGRWDLRGQPAHTTRLLGDPCLHVCFEDADPPSGPSPRLVGVHTGLWVRVLEGCGQVRAAKLRAGAARALVDDASSWTNRLVPLGDAMPGVIPRLEPDDDLAFTALAELIREHRRNDDGTSLAVALCQVVREEPNLVRVEQLVARAGLSIRPLQRLFRAHVGASPKFVIRRHRLQEAALRLERGDPVDLADLAQQLGYADQAHLTRDFKHATRVSPGAFKAEVHR